MWDALFLVSGGLFVLGAATKGFISIGAAVVILLALVLFRVVARSKPLGVGRAVRWAFAVGLPLASLAMFATTLGEGDPAKTAALAGELLALFLVLFGVYVMLRGLFTRR